MAYIASDSSISASHLMCGGAHECAVKLHIILDVNIGLESEGLFFQIMFKWKKTGMLFRPAH